MVTVIFATDTSTVSLTLASEVAAWLNADATFSNNLIATATGTTVSICNITTLPTMSINSSILIGNGTSNSILGFIGGALYESPKRPENGDKFYVSYTYAKSTSDYIPMYFYKMQDVVLEYGDVSTTNTLSLGAEAAFENGAQVVLGCQLDPVDVPDLLGFRNALNKIKTFDCNVVVAMSGDSNLYSYIKAHVDLMSSVLERRWRTAILGMTDSPSLQTIMGYATGLADNRLVLIYPPTVKRIISGTEASIGSYVLAAAIAGIRCNPNYDIAEPLTRKPVVGFTEITDNLIRSQKNELASNGVCIVETDSVGIARVRHALTTNMSTVQNSEYVITDITDYIAYITRRILEQMYIGTKILAESPAMVAGTLTVILRNLVDSKIINTFANIAAIQNATDPTQIDISFSFVPVYTNNYIYIEYTISTT